MGKSNHALVTGLFLISLIAATVAGIFWIGHLERERNLYVVSTRASVTGLNPESTVFFRGIPVGKVLSIGFDRKHSNTILVKIEIDKNVPLTKGVYATLQLKGVTGLTQLQLEDTNQLPEPIEPGDHPNARIPLKPSITDKLFESGEVLIKKADLIMTRLNTLLNDENAENIGTILTNLKNLTERLASLQKSVDSALANVPKLSADASKTLNHFDNLSLDTRKTLKQVNGLTRDLQSLTKDVKALSHKTGNLADKTGHFVDSGTEAGEILAKTTLPKANALLSELQTTTQQVKRIASMLENNPQALLLGPKHQTPGPGEPGYEENP
jgi:phospholipid/cholesterol/gamma-HCH transport system substrate-binding protein